MVDFDNDDEISELDMDPNSFDESEDILDLDSIPFDEEDEEDEEDDFYEDDEDDGEDDDEEDDDEDDDF